MDICASMPPSSYGPEVKGGGGGDRVSRGGRNRLRGGESRVAPPSCANGLKNILFADIFGQGVEPTLSPLFPLLICPQQADFLYAFLELHLPKFNC